MISFSIRRYRPPPLGDGQFIHIYDENMVEYGDEIEWLPEDEAELINRNDRKLNDLIVVLLTGRGGTG